MSSRAAEVAAVNALLESVVDGRKTSREASDELEINLGVIELLAARMAEQRQGIPARPPDTLLDYCARMMLERTMLRKWGLIGFLLAAERPVLVGHGGQLCAFGVLPLHHGVVGVRVPELLDGAPVQVPKVLRRERVQLVLDQ